MSDPARLFRHARREALVVLGLWLAATLWTVGFCVTRGYLRPPDDPLVQQGLAAERHGGNLTTVLGVPDWVFWGIVLPWLVLCAVTVGFALFVMRDDDLGREAGEAGEGGGHGS